MRGIGHVLAVYKDDACIGWIPSAALGYPTVKAWMEAQAPERQQAWKEAYESEIRNNPFGKIRKNRLT